MGESMLSRVNASLRTKFYCTNDTWLRDCVEYYMNEHNNPTHAEVLEFVISQWQLSDLREISNERPSLPNNLAQQKCTILRGHFVLQLEKLYDISESKYKQLEKIRNVSTDNIEVTESEKTQAWEPKKKRMLHLHLTDGAQNVTAVEYQPIRFLHPNLLPGYKLMIKGPVTCRRGIIMLDETKVSEIGGEVENLLVPNALENVLARALNLEENPDPYKDNIQARITEDAIFENNMSDNPDPVSNSVQTGPSESVFFDDDFDIDMEDVALLEVANMDLAPPEPSHDRPTDAITVRVPERPANRQTETAHDVDRVPLAPLNQRTESDMLFDMIDDKIFDTLLDTLPKPENDSRTISKVPKRFVPRGSSSVGDHQENSSLVTNKPKTSSSAYNPHDKSSLVTDQSKKFISTRDRHINSSLASDESNKSSSACDRQDNSSLVTKEPKTSSSGTIKKPSWTVENPCLATYMELCEETSVETNTTSGQSANKSTSSFGNAKTRETVPIITTSSFSNRPEVTDTTQTGCKRSASIFTSPMPNPPDKIRCTQMTSKIMKTNRKITDYMKKDNVPEVGESSAKRYDRICDLLSAVDTDTVQCKTVKASVTDMDRLSRNGQCWVLTATITDRTGSIDVAIASEVLSRLLGFTVAEFSQKKKLKKNNPEIENQLRLGFRSAENKLTNLCALLRVELTPSQKPKIIEIIEDKDEPKKR